MAPLQLGSPDGSLQLGSATCFLLFSSSILIIPSPDGMDAIYSIQEIFAAKKIDDATDNDSSNEGEKFSIPNKSIKHL